MDNDASQSEFKDTKSSCRTYLLTYSQADLTLVPNLNEFSDIVLDAFSVGNSKVSIDYWATCMEDHTDGGKHYHMALKLNGTRRWSPIHDYIYKKQKISINFSTTNCGYLAAYRYVCKNKPYESVLHSANHPNLRNAKSPNSKKGFVKYSENSKRRQSTPQEPSTSRPAAKRRLSNCDVAKFLVQNEIKTDVELMSVANQRQSEGESDIYSFILNKSPKSLSDLINVTWKMHNAPAQLIREQKDRMTVILENKNNPCVEGCEGMWYVYARQLLKNNNINLYVFADALRECIKKGRSKNNNIILTGPTNCGKSFLLNPIELVYKCFVNPATGKYAWIGLEDCEAIYLNDLRWTPELIAWNDFLLLLEGQTVHIPRPKNQYCTDLLISRDNDLPILATSKSAVEFVGKYNQRDERETDMMSARWREFKFSVQIPRDEIKEIKPCPCCFCTLLIQGMDM